jgi:spore maturation protein CgeB
MRVLIVGEDSPGALANSYARAFRGMGAEVQRYCTRRGYAESFPGAEARIAGRLVRGLALRRFNARLLRHLDGTGADLVLVIKGENIFPETVETLRRVISAPVVNFYPDDPFSRHRANRPAAGTGVLARYDACFTFARHLIPAYRAAGAESVHYLPFARDPELHAPVPAAEPDFDVVFAGNISVERVPWLEGLEGFTMAVYSNEGLRRVPPGSPLRKAVYFPPAFERDLPRALNRGRISVNVMRDQNRGSHNMRSFESPACGVFTLSERTP